MALISIPQTLMNICCYHAAPTSCYYSNDERLVYDIMPLSQYSLYHFTTWLSIMVASYMYYIYVPLQRTPTSTVLLYCMRCNTLQNMPLYRSLGAIITLPNFQG